jgi:hypothetical protein
MQLSGCTLALAEPGRRRLLTVVVLRDDASGSTTCVQRGAGMSEQDRPVVTQPSACKDRQGASPSVIPTGGGPAGRASRHLEPGMLLHPTHTLQSAAQRWWRLCADAETTTDTTRRAAAAVVGGGVLLVTFAYSESRLFSGPRGLRTRPIGPHGARLKSMPLLSAANDSETHHEFETSETEVRFTSGLRDFGCGP